MASKPHSTRSFIAGLMGRCLGEKKLRPELIESIARVMDVRINEIRAEGDSRISAAQLKAYEKAGNQ